MDAVQAGLVGEICLAEILGRRRAGKVVNEHRDETSLRVAARAVQQDLYFHVAALKVCWVLFLRLSHASRLLRRVGRWFPL